MDIDLEAKTAIQFTNLEWHLISRALSRSALILSPPDDPTIRTLAKDVLLTITEESKMEGDIDTILSSRIVSLIDSEGWKQAGERISTSDLLKKLDGESA